MLDKQAAVAERAEKLALIKLEIQAKAAEGGKLYGSISARDIVRLVADQGIVVSKAEIILPDGAIRNLGEFEITFRLDAENSVVVPIVITEDI